MAPSRVLTRYDAGTNQVLLQINDVRPEDAGQYTVIATNPAGEESTGGSLSVLPEKPGVGDRGGVVPTEKNRNVNQPEGETPRPLELAPDVSTPAQTKPEEQRQPRVLVPLRDGDIQESMPVVLTTTLDAGSPTATVRVILHSSSKH